MNYRHFQISTLVFLVFGVVTAFVFLQSADIFEQSFWTLFSGLSLPYLFGAALFLYKSRVGIKKKWLGLNNWALWMSATALPSSYMVFREPGSGLLVYGIMILVAQLLNLAFALDNTVGRLRTLAVPMLTASACFVGQAYVIRLLL